MAKLETYVIVGSPDKSEYGMYVKKGWMCQDFDNPNNPITRDLDGNLLQLLHTFQAKDLEEAIKYYHDWLDNYKLKGGNNA